MQKQLEHSEFKERQIKNSNDIIFILENLEHSENIGSAFRLADAFNINKIYIINNDKIDINKIKKTARNCDNFVEYEILDNIQPALENITNQGYKVFNLEITTTSKPLREVDFSKYGKIALIVGNERFGVSEETLSKVKNSCHIEMYGNNSSMNVATSLGIATYKISEDLLKLKKNEIDLER